MFRHAVWLLTAVLLSTLFLAAPASAQAPDDADRQAIRATIDGQIDAFRNDDGARAFSYAAPELQTMLGGVDAFMRMVRGGYAPVYRPRRYEFREVKTADGVVTQQVHVVGPDGTARMALYFMERQPDGSWRISGCVLLDLDGDQV